MLSYFSKRFWSAPNIAEEKVKPEQHDPSNLVELGRGTYCSGPFNLNTYGRYDLKVKVGSFTSIGGDVTFFVAGNHPIDFVSTYPFGLIGHTIGWAVDRKKDDYNRSKGEIRVGSDVWIGAKVTIMSGVEIGHGAVVGAHSVVTKNVPPYAIFCGNPAKCVGYRFSESVIDGLLKTAWWDWDDDKIESCLEDIASADIGKFLKTYLPV